MLNHGSPSGLYGPGACHGWVPRSPRGVNAKERQEMLRSL